MQSHRNANLKVNRTCLGPRQPTQDTTQGLRFNRKMRQRREVCPARSTVFSAVICMSRDPGEPIIAQAPVACDHQLVSHHASYVATRCRTDVRISLREQEKRKWKIALGRFRTVPRSGLVALRLLIHIITEQGRHLHPLHQ